MPKGLVRVPHGWWMPESERGLEKMAGMWDFCDARITTDDDPELIDIEQGIPHMKGVPCAVEKLDPYQVERLERDYSEANELMRGPGGSNTTAKCVGCSERMTSSKALVKPNTADVFMPLVLMRGFLMNA